MDKLTDKETAIIKCWRKSDFAGMQHIIAAELEIGYELESRLQRQEHKDFYCSECFLQMYNVLCKPEDGAIVGYCPNCDIRRTWIHGEHKTMFPNHENEQEQS